MTGEVVLQKFLEKFLLKFVQILHLPIQVPVVVVDDRMDRQYGVVQVVLKEILLRSLIQKFGLGNQSGLGPKSADACAWVEKNGVSLISSFVLAISKTISRLCLISSTLQASSFVRQINNLRLLAIAGHRRAITDALEQSSERIRQSKIV